MKIKLKIIKIIKMKQVFIKPGGWIQTKKPVKGMLDLTSLIKDTQPSDIETIINITYADLVAKIAASKLVPTAYYRITDYATTHYIYDGDGDICLDDNNNPYINVGATEPLIVQALDVNKLSQEAKSEQYPKDIIHYDWNSENWKFDLCFAGYDEEVLIGFKGVIYFRHDTLNDVLMGHDFRKVLNRRWIRNDAIYDVTTTYVLNNKVQVVGDGVYISLAAANVGNLVSNTNFWMKIIDYSTTSYVCSKMSEAQNTNDFIDVPCFYSQEADPEAQYNKEVKSVHLKPFKDSTDLYYQVPSIIQNNVFTLKQNFGWYQIYNIEADIVFTNNTFLGFVADTKLKEYFSGNTIGNNFIGNTIGNNFRSNIIGNYFSSNTIGNYFSYNIIGNNFSSNTIGNNFIGNIIGNNFSYNIIGNYFSYNIIGNYFSYNIIGNYFSSNTIGNTFNFNTIGNNFSGNTIGNYFEYNTVENNIKYLTTPNKSATTAFKNNNIKDSVQGTSSVRLDFTAATHTFLTYNCEIYRRPDNTFRLKYYDDTDALVVVDYNA